MLERNEYEQSVCNTERYVEHATVKKADVGSERKECRVERE